MTTTISTRVRCHNAMHRILMHEDGRFETPDCPTAGAEAGKVATMIRLGDQQYTNRAGCAPLVALCAGLPALVSTGRTKTDDLGGWFDLYLKYETHQLVRATIRRAREAVLAPNLDVLRVARAAIGRAACWRYFLDREERQARLLENVIFLFDKEPAVGTRVANDIYDDWEVPLQPGWLQNVGECKPVIDGKFIVGINPKHAGFVYAIDGDSSDGYVVREFALLGNKLGKIKS